MNNIIDLDALGTQARTVQDRWNLVIHALIRMALGGGYLDAQARLVPPRGRLSQPVLAAPKIGHAKVIAPGNGTLRSDRHARRTSG
jgi:hypothetical protein